MLHQRARFTPLDGVLIIILASLAGYMAYRIEAGLQYEWDWSVIPQYLVRRNQSGWWVPNVLLQGLLTTLRISLWGTLIATIIGTTMGIARASKSLFFRLIGGTYVELVRNLPPLVLVFICYFFFSAQIIAAIGLEDAIRHAPESVLGVLEFFFAPRAQLPSFLAALFTIAIYEGAYITEIVRAGVRSVDQGQWEAAYVLGLSPWQTMRHVILPLTIQRILPPLAGQFISTIKDSAIVSVISVQELTFQGLELMASTYLTFEIWITILALYFVMTFSLSTAARKLEAYLNRSIA
ncbi:MAG: amino acid ABC transporter permease [Desulfovibrio sp.]|uniref:amino acid ABC transporter permease n=1 Tax=Desulfovibrio sp. 7SRBS1 TaxID=3378064 RepID=UPI003B41C827